MGRSAVIRVSFFPLSVVVMMAAAAAVMVAMYFYSLDIHGFLIDMASVSVPKPIWEKNGTKSWSEQQLAKWVYGFFVRAGNWWLMWIKVVGRTWGMSS
jgi:hypothetical protein